MKKIRAFSGGNVLLAMAALLLLSSCKKENQSPESGSEKQSDSVVLTASPSASFGSSSPSKGADSVPSALIDTVVIGDLNGDHVPDTAWVDRPKDPAEANSSGGEDPVRTMTRIRFSADVPFLVDSQSVGGTLASLPDLDENGTDELVFLPEWPTSCWAGLRVYGFREGTWRMFAAASYYRCYDDAYAPDSLRGRVVKIKKGVFDMLQDQWTEDGGEMVRRPQRFTIK